MNYRLRYDEVFVAEFGIRQKADIKRKGRRLNTREATNEASARYRKGIKSKV
jgi:hypothetical protein